MEEVGQVDLDGDPLQQLNNVCRWDVCGDEPLRHGGGRERPGHRREGGGPRDVRPGQRRDLQALDVPDEAAVVDVAGASLPARGDRVD